MKKFIKEFIRRGIMAAGIGPIVLAFIYLISQNIGITKTLSVNEVSTGIFSLTLLAFIAGGMNALYQLEKLPLILGILIHGLVLYVCYLLTYLINGWLEFGIMPLLVFTGIFIVGFFIIWIIICSVIQKKTENINKILKEKQESNK